MIDARPRRQFRLGCRVGPQLIGDHDPWRDALAFEELAHQPQGCTLVSPVLQQGIEDVAIGINGAPEPVFLSLDRHHHFIKLPFVSKVAARAPTELVGQFETKLCSPFRDGLERNLNTALGK